MTYSLFKRVQSILLCAMMMISLYYTCVFSCKQLQRERIRVEALPEQIYKELSDTLGYTVDFIVGKMSLSFAQFIVPYLAVQKYPDAHPLFIED